MKRFIRRNIKHIITALLLLLFLCCAIAGIRIRSVQEVRREAQVMAGIGTTLAPQLPESGQNTASEPSTGHSEDSGRDETAGEQRKATTEKQTDSGQNEKKSVGNQSSSGTNSKNTGSQEDSSGTNSKNAGGQEDSSGTNSKNAGGQEDSSGTNSKNAGSQEDSSGTSSKKTGGQKDSSGKKGKVSQGKQGSGQKPDRLSGGVSSGRKISDGNSTKPDRYQTDPVPAGKPEPVDAEDQAVNEKNKFYVYLSIDVKTILNHKSDLKQGLEKYVPKDGWILPKTRVLCYEGETAWDVMSRECKARGIPLQSTYTQLYGSVYMEGINHIGEFDCGAASGWIYEVDGWIPNYSSSRYVMVGGEYLRWRYSCAGFGSDLDGIVKR